MQQRFSPLTFLTSQEEPHLSQVAHICSMNRVCTTGGEFHTISAWFSCLCTYLFRHSSTLVGMSNCWVMNVGILLILSNKHSYLPLLTTSLFTFRGSLLEITFMLMPLRNHTMHSRAWVSPPIVCMMLQSRHT